MDMSSADENGKASGIMSWWFPFLTFSPDHVSDDDTQD
jgi:hypothetical protein